MPRVLFAFVAIALTAVWLFVWRVPLGVPGQWTLAPNDAAWPVGAWLLPIGVVVIFGGAAALSVYDRFKRAKSRSEQTSSTVTALVCLAIVAMLWPWALLGPGQIQSRADKLTLEGRFNIIAALWSDVATEYFGAAYQINNARDYTRNYASQQQPKTRALAHVATHPPGAVLWFYGVRVVYERVPGLESGFTSLAQTVTGQTLDELVAGAQTLRATSARAVGAPEPPPLPASAIGGALFCAVLLGLSLVAAIPAIYGLAALGGGEVSEKRGLIAVAFWVLAPTTNLFAFTLDALVAMGAAWTFYFAALAWNKSNARWWSAAGVALALTSFVSIGALAVGAMIGLALVWFRPSGWTRALAMLVVSFVAIWIVLALTGNFNPLEIARNAMAAHRFATLQTRSYAPWIALNLAFWMVFIGWPLVALLARGVKLYNQSETVVSGAALGLATLAMLCLLSLSGNVRGEVERLWLFSLAPLCVLSVAREVRWSIMASLVGLQALQTLLMAATLAPLVRPF